MNTKLKLKITSLILIVSAIIFLGCKDKPQDYKIIDGIYSNSFFGIEFKIPESWYVAPDETMKYLKSVAIDMVGPEVRNRKLVQQKLSYNIHYLLLVSKYEYGSISEDTAHISIMSERISHTPAIKTGKDYLKRAVMDSGMFQLETSFNAIGEVLIDGKQFFTLLQTSNVGDKTAYVVTYARKYEDFILGIIFTFTNESDLNKHEQFLANFKFKD